ncbi:MAG: serine/threonine-protein kinase [Stenotrophobium sp.]
MFQKHCPGCFENKQGLATCPQCGYDESAERSPLFLPHGTTLAASYRVGRVLGKPGGFGVTYLVWDVHLQNRVAIKEYLPRGIAGRGEGHLDIAVHDADQQANFNFGLEQFLSEARLLAKLDHPNVVRVRNFFRAYGTAYLVMDYYDGRSLGEYLSHLQQPVEPRAAVQMMAEILDGLQFVHDRGVLHRDVKPHNIYLANNGRAILLDFGAARQAVGDQVESVSVVLSEGYAPLEQYQRKSPQGPWTDIYGVAATLYRMLIGRAPPAALDRLGDDVLERDFGLSESLMTVLRKGLAVHPDQRYGSARELKLALFQAQEMSEIAEPVTKAFASATEPANWTLTPKTRVAAADSEAPTAEVAPVAVPAAAIRCEAWLIAAAIVVAAVIISLPLWLHR